MVLNVQRNHKAYGVGGGGGGAREIIYLSLQSPQNYSCIKMGSDESHFNVSVDSDGHVRQCPQTTTFLKKKESRSGIEPRSFRLPLGVPGLRRKAWGQCAKKDCGQKSTGESSGQGLAH